MRAELYVNLPCLTSPLATTMRSSNKPSAACSKFLEGSEKAAGQWELERRFHEFEARF